MQPQTVPRQDLHQQAEFLVKPETELTYDILCAQMTPSTSFEARGGEAEMLNCTTVFPFVLTERTPRFAPVTAFDEFINVSADQADSERWPTSTLAAITHGPIWTPDVVQLVATIVPIMAVTLLGNVVIIVVLTCSKHRKINTRVNIFIVNLAIGDLSVLCCTMTTEVLFVVFEKAWILGAALCKILLYGQIVTLASTTFLLTAMSFDRYLAICRPLVSSRPKAMIAVAWLLAFLFATPQLLIFMQVPVGIYPDGEVKYKCASRGYTAWWQRKTYFTFLTIYILVVPAIIIISCYVNVARVVWRQGRSEVASNGEGVALRRTVRDARFLGRAKIKTIKMTLSIICAFIGCWTPYFVVNLVHIWSEYSYKMPDNVNVSANTLALLNSAINPLLYGCFNLQLKRGLIELCCKQSAAENRENRFRAVSAAAAADLQSGYCRGVKALSTPTSRRSYRDETGSPAVEYRSESGSPVTGTGSRQLPLTPLTADTMVVGLSPCSVRCFRRSLSDTQHGVDPTSRGKSAPARTMMMENCDGFKLHVKFSRTKSAATIQRT